MKVNTASSNSMMEKQKAPGINPDRLLFRFTILSISLIMVTGSSISPALPYMAKDFSGVSESMINLLATAPQATVLLFLLLSPFISNKIGIKRTILIGLSVIGLSGIAPLFSDNYWAILASRLLLGVGIGLFNSLAITVINKFYSGEDQSKMLGFRGGCEQIGATIATLLVGFFLSFSWHAAFLIYLLALPIAILFWKVIPELPHDEIKQSKEKESKMTFSTGPILLFIFVTLIVMTNILVMLQIPHLAMDRGIMSAKSSSWVVSLNTLGGFIGGITFGKLYTKLNKLSLPFFTLVYVIGLGVLLVASNSFLLAIGSLVAGFSGATACVSGFNMIASIVPEHSQSSANTMLLIGCNIGSFSTPYGILLAQKILGNTSVAPISFFMMVLIAIVVIGYLILKNSKIKL